MFEGVGDGDGGFFECVTKVHNVVLIKTTGTADEPFLMIATT